MFVQVYGAALVVIVSSLVLGHAICAIGGDQQRWWAAPAVGLGALIVLAGAAIKLPGKGVTAASLVALCDLTAIAFLLRRRGLTLRIRDGFWRGGLVVGGLPLLAASLLFIANGRVGLQGVTLDNDTDYHLLWAETLRSSRMAGLWGISNGYPLGPHSVVATLGSATGIPVDLGFAGLLLGIVVITALTAGQLMPAERLWRRAVVGLLGSLAYLAASYYGEGAFKETIMGALLLGFVIHLEQVQMGWSEARPAIRWRMLVPGVFLVAGAVYTYSYPALAWFAGASGIWLAAEIARHPAVMRERISRLQLSKAGPRIAAIVLIAVIVLLPIAGQALSFFRHVGTSPSGGGAIPTSALGNLIHPLSAFEMLGLWPSSDFRIRPHGAFYGSALPAFALAVALYGAWCSIRRRSLLLPSAVLACAVLWWISHRSQSPYVTAKALAIGAPVTMGLSLRALLTTERTRTAVLGARLAAAAVFCGFAAYSSYLELRNEPVQAPEATRELASFHRTIGAAPVLFLGDDQFVGWQLRPAAVTSLSAITPSVGEPAARPSKPWVAGKALDFDSVEPGALDRFPYVITGSGSYSSQAPSNFELVASARLYELWKRIGRTSPRQVLEASGEPGAVLNCNSSLGRKLHASSGYASVISKPFTITGPALLPGKSAIWGLALPKGQWAISIQYRSNFTVDLSAQNKVWRMPAYLGTLGPFFRVGTVRGNGAKTPVPLTIKVSRPSFLTGSGDILFGYLATIAATRVPDDRRIVALKHACGQYVDWYRLAR
jgi:hypothetical protein